VNLKNNTFRTKAAEKWTAALHWGE